MTTMVMGEMKMKLGRQGGKLTEELTVFVPKGGKFH
jgi:hypothetical protein